jgi:hypothetical protein
LNRDKDKKAVQRIRFGLTLDGERGWHPRDALGESTVGPLGLLSILETQLGAAYRAAIEATTGIPVTESWLLLPVSGVGIKIEIVVKPPLSPPAHAAQLLTIST